MSALVYTVISSLDGYVADEEGNFDWAAPDEDVHAFVNDLERPVGTYLYGRRLYETMVAWETMDTGPDQPAVVRDYAQLWRAAEKIVYSSTLSEVSSARTRLEATFDVNAVAQLKAAATTEVSIGGPHLAAAAIRAGLVDEIRLLVVPMVVGAGNAALPDGVRVKLTLLDERRFPGGTVYLRYRTT